MTLSPAQWTSIFDGIPNELAEDVTLPKTRAGQYHNQPEYPCMVVSIISQGIPVGEIQRDIYSELSVDKKLRTCWYGQLQRARISCVIEALDITQVETLTSLFYTLLYQAELGLNPVCNNIQFRGADPPQYAPPYRNELLKKFVHRRAVDFFVEYKFKWSVPFDTIQTIDIDIDLIESDP